ncbi:MAG: BrnT family toxin [Candidatus Omnitrophota bacterium]|nr:BrnT family toxin [Candidatus Omnitrophota bacterium]
MHNLLEGIRSELRAGGEDENNSKNCKNYLDILCIYRYNFRNEEGELEFKAFEWDEQNIEHIAEHSVTPEEAEEACANTPLILRSRHGKYLIFGQSDSGRYLTVIIKPKPAGVIRVITARGMDDAERRRYLQR